MKKSIDSMPPGDKHPHGTRARYVGAKCRCSKCRAANTAYYHERQSLAKEAVADIEVKSVDVGAPQVWTTPSGEKKIRMYKQACPGVEEKPCAFGSHLRKDSIGGVCRKCRVSLIWEGLVDASAARAHIRKLSRAGVGYEQVAEAGGVASTVVLEIRTRRKTRIRAGTERKILSVDEGARADGGLVDATATKRLIKRILKLGYTKTEIAERMGMRSDALQLSSRHVTERNAHKVRKVLVEVLGEQEIIQERRYACDSCGRSHRKRDRLRFLREKLPATVARLKSLYPCWYGGIRGERSLLRDLHSMSAFKEGEVNGTGAWHLPNQGG